MQIAASCWLCFLLFISPCPPTSKMRSTCWTQFLTPHPNCRGFKEQDQKLPHMSNTASVLRDEGAEGNLLHQAQCIGSIYIQNCDQTLGQRVWPGGRQLQGDSSWKQYVLPCCSTAGVGLSSSLWTLFCRSFSNRFCSPPLQPLWCEPCTACGPSSQSRGQERYFPLCLPTRLTFLLQRATLKGSLCLPCLPSGEWQGQTAHAGFLVPGERASLLWPGRCADTAGVCLGVRNLTGIAAGWSYAVAVMPAWIPLLVDQERSSGCLSCFWSDNSWVWQDRQGIWSKQCPCFPEMCYWPAGMYSVQEGSYSMGDSLAEGSVQQSKAGWPFAKGVK